MISDTSNVETTDTTAELTGPFEKRDTFPTVPEQSDPSTRGDLSLTAEYSFLIPREGERGELIINTKHVRENAFRQKIRKLLTGE